MFSGGGYRLAVMRLVNVAAYELRARQIADGPTLDYYDGGSNDEITLRENVSAFSRITVYPRVFRGVGQRDTSTTILGLPISTPMIVAPLALVGMLHPDGEVPVVRAASNAGSIFTLSTVSVTPIEDVVAAATGPGVVPALRLQGPLGKRGACQTCRSGRLHGPRAHRRHSTRRQTRARCPQRLLVARELVGAQPHRGRDAARVAR